MLTPRERAVGGLRRENLSQTPGESRATRPRGMGYDPPVVIEAVPTVLYQQPDGRNNLVRITVTGLEAPAARARVTDRRGRLVGTAGILPTGGGGGGGFAGEVWVPLSGPSEFQIELE